MSKSYGTGTNVRVLPCTISTLCSPQIEKSTLPSMYSSSIIVVSAAWSRSLNRSCGTGTPRPLNRRATSFSCSRNMALCV